MSKVLSVIGAAALIISAVLAVAFGIQAWDAHSLDAESRAYVDAAVPAITMHWNKEALLDRVLPGARRSFTTGANGVNFDSYARLGTLVEYQGATGDARKPPLFDRSFPPSAYYKAKAKFENGDATLHIFLTKRDGEWRIVSFNIDGWKRRMGQFQAQSP
jgi:hypothetical protein